MPISLTGIRIWKSRPLQKYRRGMLKKEVGLGGKINMKYKVSFPFIPDMGSIGSMVVKASPMETKEENTLWHLNNMREHDCLKPLKQLPKKTRFEVIWD